MNIPNMRNKLIIVMICLVSFLSKAQEVYLKVPLKGIKKTDYLTIKNVHLIKDAHSEVLSIFIEESKITYGFQYDKDLKQIAQLTSQGLKRKYKEIIGQANHQDKVRIIQKNINSNKFASILYDFKNQKTEESEYDIDLSGQKYLQSYNNGKLSYIFSIFKNTNTLRKWIFDVEGNVTFEDINLDAKIEQKKLKSLYFLLKEEVGLKAMIEVTKIENRLPNTLEVTTAENKMYAYENGFYLTLDKENEYTVLLNFALPDLHPEISLIEKPTILDNYGTTSNSYIADNKIGQIISNNKEMHLVFKNFNSLNIINEYALKKDDVIDFKNGPILQEGSVYSFGTTRKLEKASKYLRKISSYRNGLSFFNIDKGYKTIIGGVTKPATGGGGFGVPFGGLPIAGAGAFALSFNPASLAYGSYGATGSTRIESLFDNKFIHQDGEFPSNVLDEIELLSGKWLKEGDDMYIIDDFALFGNYQASKKTFGLYKFEIK